ILLALIFIIYKLWNLLHVPQNIAHIPAVPLYKTFIATLSKMTFEEKRSYLYKDLLNEHGIARYFFRSKWTILIGDAHLANEIYLNADKFPKLLSTQMFPESLAAKFIGDNVVFSNDKLWKKYRASVNSAFKIQFDTRLFIEGVSELIQVIDNNAGSEIDMSHYFRRLTMEVLGLGLMNIKFNSILTPNPEFNYHYNNIMKCLNIPITLIFQSLDTPSNPMMRSAYDSEPKDILSLMLLSMDKDEKLTDKEIRDNIMMFVLAGHDTTALALTVAIYFLCKHPNFQDKARREALAIFGKPGNDKKLPFIDSIIKESLRMYPPVAFLPARLTKSEFIANDIQIPASSLILVETFHIQNSSKYWQNPSEFNPYRFYESSNSTKIAYPATSWSPFGGGERMCSGLGFSMMEQRITLALLLLNYKFELN
ncbi:cytochrome P450, partial [Conidiobolus coronatus NRRL 28638]